MNRWKFLCIILLLCCVALAAFWGFASYRLAKAEAAIGEYVKKELKDKGFQEGDYEKPDVPDAPVGSKPLVHVAGTVHYPRKPQEKSGGSQGAGVSTSTAQAGAPAGGSPTPSVSHGTPCNLDELDVSIGCEVDIMGEPGKPWGRLLAFGVIEGYGQTRELPKMPAGELTLQVAPAAKPKTWGVNFLAGAAIGQRNGIEVGFTGHGKGRLGWYALAEYQYSTSSTSYDSYSESYFSTGDPATVRLHGGIALRLR